MRIIAAEVAIAPEGYPEVEVGMLPLDLDCPGPRAGMLSKGTEMSFERRGAIIREAQRQAALDTLTSGFGNTVTVRLTLHTSRGDLTIRQRVVLREEEPPEQSEPSEIANLPEQQYRALARSVEQGARPELSVPRDDDFLGGFHARLPHRPITPSDHAMAVFPIS